MTIMFSLIIYSEAMFDRQPDWGDVANAAWNQPPMLSWNPRSTQKKP